MNSQRNLHRQFAASISLAMLVIAFALEAMCGCAHKGHRQDFHIRVIPPARVLYTSGTLSTSTIIAEAEASTKNGWELPINAVPLVLMKPSMGEPTQVVRLASRYFVVVHNPTTESDDIYVFDVHWKPLERVEGLPVGHKRAIDCVCCQDPPRLTARIVLSDAQNIDRTYYVGLINPVRPRYEPLLERQAGEGFRCKAAGKNLIVYYSVGSMDPNAQRNVVLLIDLSSRKTRTIYSEVINFAGHESFGSVLVSPDSSTIAFDRLPYGGDNYGIWLLGLKSGKCLQITFEDNTQYAHNVISWTNSQQLNCVSLHSGSMRTFLVTNLPDINK